MTTMKNPLTDSSQLPNHEQVRPGTASKLNLSPMPPILPNASSKAVLEKCQSKKRVRFALRLESVEEKNTSSLSKKNKFLVSAANSKRRIVDPWREDGPLYGAYVEYLEKQGALTSNKSDMHRPSRLSTSSPSSSPLPTVESAQYTHAFCIQNKSPDISVDSMKVVTPSVHLPRIALQTKVTKTNNNNNNNNSNTIINRRPSLSIIDPNLKIKCIPAPPLRAAQSKKKFTSTGSKSHVAAAYPNVKQDDLSLPSIKDLKFHEKMIRTDNPVGSRFINEYCTAKKLTEIISGSLPGTNNQIHYIPDRSILPNLPKQPSTPCHNQISSETYFFQNHNKDHLQPVIH